MRRHSVLPAPVSRCHRNAAAASERQHEDEDHEGFHSHRSTRGAGVQIDPGQRCLQEGSKIFGTGIENCAADQQQVGETQLTDLEASRRELFVLVEAGNRLGFEDTNSGEPAVIRLERRTDFQLHASPSGVELGPKSGRAGRTDRPLLLSL